MVEKKMNFEESEEFAVWMHDEYEKISTELGWATQEKCKVMFAELPRENRDVMLVLARRILKKHGKIN